MCFLVLVSQGWTSVSDGSGSGRRSVLFGSGGRHYRAHPPLHPGSCSQHLQCHADEPQLCSANTSAVQLAAPLQVKMEKLKHGQRADLKSSEKCNHAIIVLLLVSLRTFAESTPSVLKKTSEWERQGVTPWDVTWLLSDSSGEVLPSLKLLPVPPGSRVSAQTKKRWRRDGWSPMMPPAYQSRSSEQHGASCCHPKPPNYRHNRSTWSEIWTSDVKFGFTIEWRRRWC